MNVTPEAHRPADQPSEAPASQGSLPPATGAEGGKTGTSRPKFRSRNVVLVLVPVAILAIAVLGVSRFADLDALVAYLQTPKVAPATGQVLYKGQPLRNGQLKTVPTGRGLSAIGWTDEEGRFSLKTDLRGKLVDGATVGEHRVAVSAREAISMPGGPPLVTPAEYASVSTSPFRIIVDSDPANNQFEFILEGEPPARPAGAGKGKGKGGGMGTNVKKKPQPKGDAPKEP